MQMQNVNKTPSPGFEHAGEQIIFLRPFLRHANERPMRSPSYRINDHTSSRDFKLNNRMAASSTVANVHFEGELTFTMHLRLQREALLLLVCGPVSLVTPSFRSVCACSCDAFSARTRSALAGADNYCRPLVKHRNLNLAALA